MADVRAGRGPAVRGATVEPIATYRFQLTPAFGFDAVADRLDHVRRLGVSHAYLSPIAEAVPGSQHGYDVVDHTVVRAELGGAAGFERLLDECATRGMAVLVDHVPNHVATTRPELNPRWWALLRDGPGSDADDWFDVDWELSDGRVILPVLGGPLPEVLDGGHLARDGDTIWVYGERQLPVAPGTGDGDLAAVLARQHYDLRFWRDPARNVRRFFTIDDLVAVRVEHADVAAAVDTLPGRYAEHPGFGGIRVDHIDGLADPEAYLHGLRDRIGDVALLYVEKILAPGEVLPPGWPVDGTTGYDFLRDVDQVLTAAEAKPVFDRRWEQDSGDGRDFHAWEVAAKAEVVEGALAPDVERVVRVATRATGGGPDDVAAEVRRLTIDLPRYRTYLPHDPDADHLIGAISDGPVAAAIRSGDTPEATELRTRWQQLTGPVMAKGAEDRAFYRYLRLASLCEVGGDPATFGIDADAFHAANAHRAAGRPQAMLAGSTHDTKRSEDVRARSAAMTWRVVDRRYRPPNRDHANGDDWTDLWRRWVDELAGSTGVDAVTVSLAVQTVTCTPGLDADRLAAYLVKACREAATHTDWVAVDDRYERRLTHLAARALDIDVEEALGLDAIAPGVSLASLALRLTAPGVPDVYQGTEAFSYRLVDPDNRVPPDWAALDRAARDERCVAELWAGHEPAVKTALVRDVLALRRRRTASFGPGAGYTPLAAGDGVVAYARGDDVVVVVRRGIADVDGSVDLPAGTWYDVLDPGSPTLAGRVSAASLVGSGADLTLPVAVLERD